MALNKEFFVSLDSSAHADNGGGYDPATYGGSYAAMFAANDGPIAGPTTDATYTYASGTITKVGAFNSTLAGMYVRIVSGTGVTAGRYVIVSRTNDTLVLGNNIGGTTDGATVVCRVGGALTAAAGLTSSGLTTSMRVNIKSGTYSALGALTQYTATAVAPVVYRGYTTTPGDLDVSARKADGTLDTTNMPYFSGCAVWTPGAFCQYQNLNFSGALSGALISSTSVDNFSLVNCKFLNTTSNAAARCIIGDDGILAINCDFEDSGATHVSPVDCDVGGVFIGCRFKGVTAGVYGLTLDYGVIEDCVFLGPSGIQYQVTFVVTVVPVIKNCTFYNCTDAVTNANAAAVQRVALINCHATGSTRFLNNPYSATSDICYIEINNRTRNNTTPRTGIRQCISQSEVTTAGSDATDFKSVAGRDYTLIPGAPGRNTGMLKYTDIGAYQHNEPVDRPEMLVIGS